MTQDDRLSWHKLVQAESAFYYARMAFFKECEDKVAVVREALANPAERGTALRVAQIMPLEQRDQLLEALLPLASWAHGDIELVRAVIGSLSQDLLKTRIEALAEPLLAAGGEEEYRRLLELYQTLDQNLVSRLVARAMNSDDPEIVEAGEDFFNHNP